MRRTRIGLAVLALPALSGCYLLRQGWGQLDIVTSRRNVHRVLEGSAREDDKAKLRLCLEIKAFGERYLGIRTTDNFTTYYDTRGKPVSWSVTASRKDRFEAYVWSFPIIGKVPYKGFFDRDDAVEEAKELQAKGYDVNLGVVGAYSTLGWFSDPIFSSMLDQSEEELAELILHELTHSTVYSSGHGDFNESLATFVGREGAIEFVRRRWGSGSEIHRRAVDRFADEDRMDEFMHEVYRRLDAYYRTNPANVLAGREEIWKRAQEEFRKVQAHFKVEKYEWFAKAKINNALVQGRRRYGRTDLFRRHFVEAGGDWRVFFDRMRAVAKAPDPMKALEVAR